MHSPVILVPMRHSDVKHREQQDVARRAEVVALLDDDRRLAPLDPQTQPQRGRHDGHELDAELDGLAQRRRAEDGHPQAAERGHPQLRAEVEAEGRLAGKAAGALEHRHDLARGEARSRDP